MIRYTRRSITLTVLFIILYLSFVSIHIGADRKLDYVSGSRFQETKKTLMTTNLESGVYFLILDNTGLSGPIGKIFPLNFGLLNVKGEIRASSTTILNEFLSFNEIIEIRFLVSSTQNVLVTFDSTREISGAIYKLQNISKFDDAKTISSFRLIPFMGMIAILVYGTFKFAIRLKDSDYNFRDAIWSNTAIGKKSEMTKDKEASINPNDLVGPINTNLIGASDEPKLSRKERKEIERKIKEEAKLLAVQEAATKRKQELETNMRERIGTFRKIVSRSAKLRIDQLAKLLDMEQKDLLKWLYNLPEEFGFVINQDIVEFDTVKIGDSIDKVLSDFDNVERTMDGKLE